LRFLLFDCEVLVEVMFKRRRRKAERGRGVGDVNGSRTLVAVGNSISSEVLCVGGKKRCGASSGMEWSGEGEETVHSGTWFGLGLLKFGNAGGLFVVPSCASPSTFRAAPFEFSPQLRVA